MDLIIRYTRMTQLTFKTQSAKPPYESARKHRSLPAEGWGGRQSVVKATNRSPVSNKNLVGIVPFSPSSTTGHHWPTGSTPSNSELDPRTLLNSDRVPATKDWSCNGRENLFGPEMCNSTSQMWQHPFGVQARYQRQMALCVALGFRSCLLQFLRPVPHSHWPWAWTPCHKVSQFSRDKNITWLKL